MRIASISWIRMMATIMIVLCHYLQAYSNGLAYFLMWGYRYSFLISGFLYGGKEITFSLDWLQRRFKKIAIRYFVVVLLVAFCYLALDKADFKVIELIKVLFFSGTLKGIEHLWFVPYIMFCYAITPYLQALKSVSGGAFSSCCFV